MPVNVNENTSPQEIQVLNNGERADAFRKKINDNFEYLGEYTTEIVKLIQLGGII